MGYGVIAEVEVLQVDMVSGLANGLKEVNELVVTVEEQFHPIVGCDGNLHASHIFHHHGITGQ